MQKTLFIILDGAADDGLNTPLAEADMPNLDMLARHSLCGMWNGPKAPEGYNVRSLSEIATLKLLGYEADESPGRGYIEALGIGLKPDKRAVYFRANFATVDNKLKIIDRRAGRDERGLDELAKLLNMKIDDVDVEFLRTQGHRGVIVLTPKKGGVNRNVSDSDIGSDTPHKIKPTVIDADAQRTASILNEFSVQAHERLAKCSVNSLRKLPANYVLLRGAGQYKEVEPFKKRWNMKACCIAEHRTIKGIARYLGMDVITPKGATAGVDTDLHVKINSVIDAFKTYDFILLHINGADTVSHDKKPKQKQMFLERIDHEIFRELVNMRNINIVVAIDHITSCKTGEHVFGAVPFMLYTPEAQSNGIERFDEHSCVRGFKTSDPMHKVITEIMRE